MSVFNGSCLTNEVFEFDVERMRQGWYSDKYFNDWHDMIKVCHCARDMTTRIWRGYSDD